MGKGGCHLLTGRWVSRPLLAGGRGATLIVCGRSVAVPARKICLAGPPFPGPLVREQAFAGTFVSVLVFPGCWLLQHPAQDT